MTDRPILFSAPMVRAILDGHKNKTRRILTHGDHRPNNCIIDGIMAILRNTFTGMRQDVKLRYRVGDRLWVKETWKVSAGNDRTKPSELYPTTPVYYTADDRLWPVARRRPSIFMPRWASRLTLTVTDVRVERLQDISEADAVAEGIVPALEGFALTENGECWGPTAKDAFRILWDSINGDRKGASWADNPWVVAISFDVAKRNIDQ